MRVDRGGACLLLVCELDVLWRLSMRLRNKVRHSITLCGRWAGHMQDSLIDFVVVLVILMRFMIEVSSAAQLQTNQKLYISLSVRFAFDQLLS